MTDAYAPALRELARTAGLSCFGVPLREAIYAGMAGPQYETPAEVRLLRTLGAGLVGMSTVLEVIAARHAGMSVLGLSLVANHAAGVTGEPLRHEDVTRAATAGTSAMTRLVGTILSGLP
jgi:purine-nucleoside phosphorylase